MDIILKNTTKHPKRMLVFNLTREVSGVKVTNRTTEESRDGLRRIRQTSKLVPDSLRIAHGEEVTVPESYLKVPEIARAIERREVKARKPPEDTGPKPEKVAPRGTKSQERKKRR